MWPKNPPMSFYWNVVCWFSKTGLLEGRKVFANLVKYIRMGASSNFGNMFSMTGSSYFLSFLPMAPIQILVNNLLYDFSQTGIPSDHVDEELLLKPRKWNIGNIQRFMFVVGRTSSLFDYATFALMLYGFPLRRLEPRGSGGTTSPVCGGANVAPDDTYAAALFHSGWFVESLIHIDPDRSCRFGPARFRFYRATRVLSF